MRTLFILLTILFIISSCAPKVTTKVLVNYEPFDRDYAVLVYDLSEKVTDSAQVIALISVTEKPSSPKCKYPDMIKYAAKETRKVGGNAFKITDHWGSSFWKGCHQIQGVALRTHDFDSLTSKNPLMNIDNFTIAGFNQPDQNIEAKYANAFPGEISFNWGYGNVVNRTKGISGDEKAYEKTMSNGFSWDINLTRVYRRGFGWGVIYSGYTASTEYRGANHRNIITYIAPMFVGKAEMGKWVYKCKLGIGYLGYRHILKEGNQKGRAIGRNVGSNYGLGIDYKLSEKIGFGVEASGIAGSLSSLKYKNLVNTGEELSKDNRMGLSHINILFGIRYYFGNY